MKKLIVRFKHLNEFELYRIKVLCTYNLLNIILALTLYHLVPTLMNYPPNFREYLRIVNGPSYEIQFVIIFSIFSVGFNLYVIRYLKRISITTNKHRVLDISALKRNLNFPYMIYFVQILLSIISVTVILAIVVFFYHSAFLFIFKICILVLSLISLVNVVSLIYHEKILKDFLSRVFTPECLPKLRISIKKKIFFNMIPIIISTIFLTSLIGYSILLNDRGKLLFEIYAERLHKQIDHHTKAINLNEIKNRLNKYQLHDPNDSIFIITPNKTVISFKGKRPNRTILVYALNKYLSYNGHLYSDDGEEQGVIVKVPAMKGYWTMGIVFEVLPIQTELFFGLNFFILLSLNIVVLQYFAKSLTDDISKVSQGLTAIAENDNFNLNKKLPVTSNDEIGDLVAAFNRILDLQKKNLSNTKVLAIIKERNRFARDVHDTLGQTMTLLVTLLSLAKQSCQKGLSTEEYLSRAAQIAGQGLNDLRRSAKGLAYERLATNQLNESLQELAAEFTTSGVTVDFIGSGIDNFDDSRYTDAIYRICQEAMTNSVRHGHAKRIMIEIFLDKGWIKLKIKDDGLGCKTINKGFGLSGMEERVRNLNGTINFCSDGLKGFAISIKISLESINQSTTVN